ncbi:Bacteriophage HK97-gp10, putative tail-component [uncultured Caudovirales phage]|uniref:Bacteriophage HK97-gp10, putative tail-component n=1 Tax=uncultured Caudovirales phage TaxID=2100421 RepID=A0A6J5RQA7_9CAUD|nr:Bacteriophage HK97-gp10, putative tail-component [uncultured Caudovirales phage]CAB4173677.1 Bacteriophage HK97-gp10, putative tail-component [uncultured Caudovirales phage]CAB4180254.1 Bacteriophage HK97-gp10, putative tail-component [uncultured Caudovirales phage]CAB4193994.1 Bacteriophage HK97-gp10, putative tail-component [uncultured Caudovirales phage]
MAGTGQYGFRLDSGQGKLGITGLADVNKALRSMSKDTRDSMKETHKRAAEIVIQGAKRYVPVVTGRLAASIRNSSTQRMGRVRVGSASVPYAGPIHFGWPARQIKPQPFIYDALDGRRAEVAAVYVKRIDELTVKYFK